MISLILISFILSGICPETKVVNLSNDKWNDGDTQTMENSRKHCGEIYPEFTCLHEFRKITKTHYEAICALPEE